MLKTTSQQLIDSLGFEGGRVGQPMVIGAALAQDKLLANTHVLYAVPKQKVLLVTHVVLQIDPTASLPTLSPSGGVPSPQIADSFSGIQLRDAAGTVQYSLDFRGFARYASIFSAAASPTEWKTAAPGNAVTWKLKYPIPVPPGWTIGQAINGYAWGNQSAVYGVVVDEFAARDMGYHASYSTTDSERRYGIASTSGATSETEVIPARTGQSIRILDVQVRMQPEVPGSNTITLQQGDGTKVFVCTNDNPAEHVNMQFAPGWFLKAGQALNVISDVAGVNSINLTYEYVDEDEVPPNVWFSVVEPESPTPGTITIGSPTVPALKTSNEVTCYYPRRGTTETSPLKGFQHLLNGYVCSLQKTAGVGATDDDSEQTRFAISTGSSSGVIGLTAAGEAQSNYQLTPVLSGSGHDQVTWCAVDGVNVPGQPDNGSLWVDVINFRAIAATPTSGDADIRRFSVNLWGRTAPKFVTPRTNKGD